MQDRGPKYLSRRDLLNLGMGFAAGAAAATVGNWLRIPESIPDTKAIEPSRISSPVLQPNPEARLAARVIVHDNLPARVALQATATALKETNQQSSFKENAEFSREIFEQVKQGVFAVNISIERDTPNGFEKINARSTGWLAKTDNDEHYIVTNGHSFPDGYKINGISIGRPSTDKELLTSSQFSYVTSKDPDIALIKLKGKFTPRVLSLNWQDNFAFSPKAQILVVGFPLPFERSSGILDFATSGETGQVILPLDNKKTKWIARAFVTGGSSGSPVVVLIDNNPTVVGIMYATSNKVDLQISETEIQNQEPAIFTSLQLTPLINALNQLK